jgi:transposase-like protein
MTETIPVQVAGTKADQWRERIAEQERTGVSVKQFCKQHGLTEYCFYAWRKRLRKQAPVRFALVERGVLPGPSAEISLELVLTSGERLRIGAGVDAATLRTVLETLRA